MRNLSWGRAVIGWGGGWDELADARNLLRPEVGRGAVQLLQGSQAQLQVFQVRLSLHLQIYDLYLKIIHILFFL